jgi:hypothetical protein
MAKNKLIFDTRDLENYSDEMISKIDKAVVAAAFKIRDEIREEFKKSANEYANHTEKYNDLAEGIMVGKLKNSQIKVHAMGSNEKPDTFKTRFFVGGTVYRKTNKGNKGFIKSNASVDKGLRNAEDILNTFIKNTLDN